MGYNDTMQQADYLLSQMGLTYVDLLLNHWPTSPASPTVDPLCDPKKTSYNAKGCRLSTWRAYVDLWHAGKTLAIGVANYGISDLQEIIDAGMPLPTVNQIPFHLYNAAAQLPLVAWCKAHDIVVLSYSPLGIPGEKGVCDSATTTTALHSHPPVILPRLAHDALLPPRLDAPP